VISQLLYEINGPLYYNSDVVAHLEDLNVEQLEEDHVLVTGVKGSPPPPTTRVGITAHGGYQAEFHFTLVGLDIPEKTKWMEEQIRHSMGEQMIQKFSMLKFHRHGTCPDNPSSQEFGTVDFRIFAQARDPDIFELNAPNGFNRKILETVLQSVPVSDQRKLVGTQDVRLTIQGCCTLQRHKAGGCKAIFRVLGGFDPSKCLQAPRALPFWRRRRHRCANP
jgi:hypothetical protein